MGIDEAVGILEDFVGVELEKEQNGFLADMLSDAFWERSREIDDAIRVLLAAVKAS